ncbi:MAG: Rid family hydrolase [Dermatophilaceae bacterium]
MSRPRQTVSSGSTYEPRIGFSRAVRVGGVVAVAGTAPIGPDGNTVGHGDVYQQTVRCLDIIQDAVEQTGLTLDNVVRTRIMLTDLSHWEEAARAHGDRFTDIRPAATFVQVAGFLDPSWLVEIEADAIAGPD